MKSPNNLFRVVFKVAIILIISNLCIFTAYGQNNLYENLKAIPISNNREEVINFFKDIDSNELFELARQASSNNDSEILYNVIAIEIIQRIRQSMPFSNIISELENDTNELYRNMLMGVINSVQKYGSNNDHLILYNILKEDYLESNRSISKVGSSNTSFITQKLQAIVICNDIMAEQQASGESITLSFNEYCQSIEKIMMDENEDPEIRRAAVKGIYELKYERAIPNLLRLISDNNILNNPPLAKSVCLALGSFKEESAVKYIQYILENTSDEYIFASAATALGDLGGNDALKILIENENKFQSNYTGATILTFESLIMRILSNNITEYVPYAIKATKYLYKEEQVNQYKTLLKTILFKNDDNEITRLILERLAQVITKEEAIEIVEKIPRDNMFAQEWDFINNFAHMIETESQQSTEPTEETINGINKTNSTMGNYSEQEYGDPGYKDNDILGGGLLGGWGIRVFMLELIVIII